MDHQRQQKAREAEAPAHGTRTGLSPLRHGGRFANCDLGYDALGAFFGGQIVADSVNDAREFVHERFVHSRVPAVETGKSDGSAGEMCSL
jgi:acyl-CoA thioesterase